MTSNAAFYRITVEPGKCGGKACIRGMRITVRRLLEIIATYRERDEIFREYPFLEEEDLQQALRYAARLRGRRRSLSESGRVNRVLLDQGLAPNTAALLRLEEEWDAIHVSEVGMSRADDEEILRFARQHNRRCVTLDHDFHTHRALSQSDGPSVVLVRIEGLDSVQQADLIRRVWCICVDDIETGAAVSVDRRAVRVRRLPLR